MSITVGSLFSGIGGLDLGLEQAGMETIWQVEYDDWARESLNQNFPHTEKFKDVREVGKHNLRPVDLICGGFPCTDVSVSNTKGQGLDGERSGLWTEQFRILCELRPKYALIENVANLITRGLARVLCDLASIGYDAEWRTLRAADFGMLHRRKRLFILAHSGSVRPPVRTHQIHERPDITISSKRGSDTPELPIHLFGRSYFPVPGNLCMDNGISYELSEIEAAVKGYGNAVCPPVAKWIGERIIQYDRQPTSL